MEAIKESSIPAKKSRTNVSPTVSTAPDALMIPPTAYSSPSIGNETSPRKRGSPIYDSTLGRYNKLIYLIKNEVMRQLM